MGAYCPCPRAGRMTLGFGAHAIRMDHSLERCHVAQIFGRARRGPECWN